MSYPSDRYGYVPPAQYPVGYQSQDHLAGANGDDDATMFDDRPTGSPALGYQSQGRGTNDTNSPSVPQRGFVNASSAMAGPQHPYQTQPPSNHTYSAYNPQDFARAPSTTLPYRPVPPPPVPPPPGSRYATPASPTFQSPAATTNYTPAAYNPAAYATNATVPQRQATTAGHAYNSFAYASSSVSQSANPFTRNASPTRAALLNSYAAPPNTTMPSTSPERVPSSATTSHAPYEHAYEDSTPYPVHSQIPVGPHSSDADVFSNRTPRANSQSSVNGSAGLQRHPTNAPLPSRPMNEQGDVWLSRRQTDEYAEEHRAQDSLMNDIVSDLGRTPRVNGTMPDELDRLRRFNSTASSAGSRRGADVERYASNASSIPRSVGSNATSTYDWEHDDDESDPEGAGGLLAMQEDMDDRRFSTITIPSHMGPVVPSQSHLPAPAEEQVSLDSDFGGVDLGLYGGGYPGHLQYGNEGGLLRASGSTREGRADADVLVDHVRTDGVQHPQPNRLSFDEGDERVSVPSGSESPYKEDFPDIFYHPGLTNRPLPDLPPGSESRSISPPAGSYSADSGPSDSQVRDHQLQVERSTSLTNHSTTAPVYAPVRSRTDAADERRRAQRLMAQQGHQLNEGDTGTPSSLDTYDAITLPTGRKRKFVPTRLSAADVRRCPEPWALSCLTAWIREMIGDDQYLTRKMVEDGIVSLFCAKVPTMNVTDLEVLGTSVVDSMFAAGVLLPDEDVWVKFGPGLMSGVLWPLTGSGCYAPKLHDDEEHAPRFHDKGLPMRCYSPHCTRTLRKVDLDQVMPEEVKQVAVKEDWHIFWKLSEDDLKSKPKAEVKRQSIIHEIIYGEEGFMNDVAVLTLLYRDQLRAARPPVIATNRLDRFLDDVFGQCEAVMKVNMENLLSPLKYRQREQGPYITGCSDIFREWVRKAKPIYFTYFAKFPRAQYLIKTESQRNMLFRQFLVQVSNHKMSRGLDWTNFLHAPMTRFARYDLLLKSVLSSTEDETEKANMVLAYEEVKAAASECDQKLGEEKKIIELIELQSSLVLRPGFQSVLNLDHMGRELMRRGDLQRQGSKGVRWVDTHALLFDNYFILAKQVKDGRTDKKFDVSKEPIPMPLLFLESVNDDPVSRQNRIAAPLTRAAASAGSVSQLGKVVSNGDRPGLETASTGSSVTVAVTRLTPTPATDDRIIYPFRVKHLGHEVYTLYASSPQDRQDWCDAIIGAKEKHAQSLYKQNAEPFSLGVLADTAFAYDSASAVTKQAGATIRHTPLDRAVRDMEAKFDSWHKSAPICRSIVNCAAAFSTHGKKLMLVGTDYGVFLSEASNPRGWARSVQMGRVTQIAVLEDFNVCLLIADRSLVSYPLDVVAPASGLPGPAHDSPRRAPQRLAKDVAFFATARMKDRMLVFYKRKEGMHSTFKVLEPVLQKATEKKSRLFRTKGGSTESFRDYDEFYLPADCFGLNLFQTYIAVASAKGFELLTLDKKITQSIPRDLTLPAIANIAGRVRDQRPLGMFRLNDQEFLLAYEDCAVYVDKHGEVSRTLIMEYSGKQKRARGATMYGQYLVLFNEDYVEVRNAENGRLRQIIAGRDVRCIDYGYRGPTGAGQQMATQGGHVMPDWRGTVKLCMSHPEVPGGQIVLEMVLNEGHTEK